MVLGHRDSIVLHRKLGRPCVEAELEKQDEFGALESGYLQESCRLPEGTN